MDVIGRGETFGQGGVGAGRRQGGQLKTTSLRPSGPTVRFSSVGPEGKPVVKNRRSSGSLCQPSVWRAKA